jgi:hypothetical protein
MAYMERHVAADRRLEEDLLVRAGLCSEENAPALLAELQQQVLDVLAAQGPATVRQISQAVPELQAKVRHSRGKSYEGEFSVGSRLVPGMCMLGLLIRARPRGSWRSNLYTYTVMSDWLPAVDMQSVTPQEARIWLVRRYLSAFGPATFEDAVWWTGFSRGETEDALASLRAEVLSETIQGLGDGFLMLVEEAYHLLNLVPADDTHASFLPALDPYIMGYRDRRRFLDPGYRAHIFDRAGNAVPTVWVNGRVAGIWGQRKDGSVAYGLFVAVSTAQQALIEGRRRELEVFLDGEYLPQRFHTPFSRSLQ